MKKILVITIFLLVLLMTNVSAFSKTYDPETETITITNAGTDIINLQLIENTYFCITDCHALLKLDVLVPGQGALFTSIKIQKEIDGVWQSGELEEFEIQHNNSGEFETVNRGLLNAELVTVGTTYVKFVGVKEWYEAVDWIPFMVNELDLDEWALWDSSNILAYYEFDEGLGTSTYDVLGLTNFSFLDAPAWTTGLIGSGLDFEEGESNYLRNETVLGDIWTNAIDDINSSIAVNIWINMESAQSAVNNIVSLGDYFTVQINTANNLQGSIQTDSAPASTWKTTGTFTTTGTWKMITMMYNGTGVGGGSIYIDGVPQAVTPVAYNDIWNPTNNISFYIGSQGGTIRFFDGIIDLLGVWNKSLTQDEINQLYNSGLGSVFGGMNFTTNSPDPGQQDFLGSSTLFNVSASSPTKDFTNATLWINDISNGTNIITGTYNTTTFTRTLTSGTYEWLIEFCNNDSNCRNSSRQTYSIGNIFFNDVNFSNPTLEGSTDTFSVNVTWDNTVYPNINADLVYNGTTYETTKVLDGGTVLLSTIINIPQISTQEEVSFYWDIDLVNSTTTVSENSSIYNQTINPLNVGNCTTYGNLTLNFTMYDEEFQNVLPNGSYEVEFNLYTLDRTVNLINFSQLYNNTASASICIENFISEGVFYSYDTTVKYTSTNYSIEYYHIQNATASNTTLPQNIKLYPLLAEDTTEFQITFKDSSFNIVSDAIISINRQYVSEGVFRTVEIPKTDANGQTVAHLVQNDVKYNMIVSKDGEIIGIFNNLIAFCNPTVGICTISLNALESNDALFDVDLDLGISYTLNYDPETRLLVFQYNSIDGSTRLVNLTAKKYDQLGTTTACNDALSSSSGTLSCTIGSAVGNGTLEIEIYIDNVLTFVSFVDLGKEVDIGDVGYLLLVMMLLTFPMLFIESKIATVVGVIIGFIASMGFAFIQGGVLGVGSALIWLLIAGGILIYSLNKGKNT